MLPWNTTRATSLSDLDMSPSPSMFRDELMPVWVLSMLGMTQKAPVLGRTRNMTIVTGTAGNIIFSRSLRSSFTDCTWVIETNAQIIIMHIMIM